MALRPYGTATRRGASESRVGVARGAGAGTAMPGSGDALTPFSGDALTPFSMFGGHDPFKDFSTPGFGGSMMSKFDNMAADMLKGFPTNGSIPGGGSYSCQTFAMSSMTGKDGKVHTERYCSSDVGNPQHGIREAQHAYSNSTSGVDKMGLERHLGERARKMVKERNRNTMEEKCSEMLRGMDENGRDHFERDFGGLSQHLPSHGRGFAGGLEPGRFMVSGGPSQSHAHRGRSLPSRHR
ncbi:unnamed protein product [Effrenium voratum]|nr:unnamed protein product [Effrenium voratum]